MSKDKKPWNFWEYLGMVENSSGNFWEFLGSLKETVSGFHGKYWELQTHTNENLWEFLGILNDSKNFKVIVNLKTFGFHPKIGKVWLSRHI